MFPGEDEILFRPLTFLQPTGNAEKIEVGGIRFTVVEVEPRSLTDRDRYRVRQAFALVEARDRDRAELNERLVAAAASNNQQVVLQTATGATAKP
jgi:hypothetical protein